MKKWKKSRHWCIQILVWRNSWWLSPRDSTSDGSSFKSFKDNLWKLVEWVFIASMFTLADPIERTVREYSDRSLTPHNPASLWLRTIKKTFKSMQLLFVECYINVSNIVCPLGCHWRQCSGSPWAERLHRQDWLFVEVRWK